MTITPDQGPYAVGDVLTCSADGYPLTYEWTDMSNGNAVVSSTNTITLSEGPFSYTCAVDVEGLECPDTDDISGIGKYWKVT